MTRIIAGVARGRRLQVPGTGTRPTSDRVREAVFSSVESVLRAEDLAWPDVAVLDLYAGSGALGLEALSRGARAAVLVERSRPAARVLAANLEVVGRPGGHVMVRDVAQLASVDPVVLADLCFADPPYELAAMALRRVLTDLADAGWLAPGALVIVERASRDGENPLPDAWSHERTRPYGDTTLWYGRFTEAEPTDDRPGDRSA